MTSPVNFEEEWALLAPKLAHWLVSRGADPETAEDVSQDAALRSYRRHRRRPFTGRRDLRRYAWHVASNRLTDIWRMRTRHEAPGPAPTLASADDVPSTVVHRLAVGETATALAALAPSQRRALLGEVQHRLAPNAAAEALASLPGPERPRCWPRSRASRKFAATTPSPSPARRPANVWARS